MTQPLTNPALEDLLLAKIYRDNRLADQLGRFHLDDLSSPEKQALLETMLALHNEGRGINDVTLGAEIASDPLGGPKLFERVKAIDLNSNPASIGDITGTLIDLASKRQLLALNEQMASRLRDPKAKTPDLISGFFKEFDDLLSRSSSHETLRSIADAVDRATDRWQQPDDGRAIPTGLTDFDAALGGLDPGDLIVLAGRPSMGKTACATHCALEAAKRGYGVIFFSLEMREEHVVARMASEECGIPYKAAIRRQLSDRNLEIFIRAATGISHLPLLIDDGAAQTTSQIAAKVRRTANDFERRGKRLSLVIIDHLTKLRFDARYAGNRVLEVGEATGALASLAKSQDVAVLCLSQLNRQVDSRENKRPQLTDLRESGAIEQDADVVIFPFREAYYLERTKYQDPAEEKLREDQLARLSNVLELQIAKCRNGETVNVEVFADMATNRLRNLEWRNLQ
jgi:replicative DNA helicase